MLEEIAKFIRVKRAELDITQEQLAERSGVSLKSITNLESCVRVRNSTLEKVVNSLGYKVKYNIEFLELEEIH